MSEHIRKHLMEHLGVCKCISTNNPLLPLKYDWSPEFEYYRRNRMIIGYLRHGPVGASDRPKYDHVSSAIERLKLYLVDGNQEHLVDTANLVMLEFINPCCHSSPSFRAQDDKNHTPVKE